MHEGLGGVDGLSAHQEHDARGVQLEPHLLDDAIEIELQRGANLFRQDRITLLGVGGLGPLADAQNLHCHVSDVGGLSEGKPDTTKGINRELSCPTALKSMKKANPPPMIDIMRTHRRVNCSRT